MKSVGEGKLQYLGSSADTNYYNIAKNLAELNARNEEITDRKGNLYGYWCKVSSLSTANDILVLAYVPNTWKVRNAFRRFHFAREHMFRQAGVTKREMGKYGRTLRPYLSQDHQTSGDEDLRIYNVGTNAPVDATGGEWTYTTLASAPTFGTGSDVQEIDIAMTDEWSLTILGSHRLQSTSVGGVKMWTSVSMTQAYAADRMEQVPDATADTSITGLNNPLAALQAQNVVSGEVTDIAEEQQLEEPPYDVADAGDNTRAVFDLMPVSGTAGDMAQHRSWGLFFFPAGIVSLQNTATNSNILEIEVLGKELCKDVA